MMIQPDEPWLDRANRDDSIPIMTALLRRLRLWLYRSKIKREVFRRGRWFQDGNVTGLRSEEDVRSQIEREWKLTP